MKTLKLLLGLTICIVGNSRADEKPLQKAIQIPLQKSVAPKQILAQISLKKTEEIQSAYSFYDGKLKNNVWMVFKRPKPGRYGGNYGKGQMLVFDEEKKANRIIYRKVQVFDPLPAASEVKLFYLNSKTKKGLVLDNGNSFLYAFPAGFERKQMFIQDFTYDGDASVLVSYNFQSVDDRGFLKIDQQSGIYDGENLTISDQRSWLWNGQGWTNPNQ